MSCSLALLCLSLPVLALPYFLLILFSVSSSLTNPSSGCMSLLSFSLSLSCFLPFSFNSSISLLQPNTTFYSSFPFSFSLRFLPLSHIFLPDLSFQDFGPNWPQVWAWFDQFSEAWLVTAGTAGSDRPGADRLPIP